MADNKVSLKYGGWKRDPDIRGLTNQVYPINAEEEIEIEDLVALDII